jgi:hypothetical protein
MCARMLERTLPGSSRRAFYATLRLSKKLHSLLSSIRRIIQTRGHSCADPRPSRCLGGGEFCHAGFTPTLIRPENEHDLAAAKLVMRNRRTLPSRQRTHIRLRARVDRLEDATSHFYNVANQLRRRVSALEKKLKPLAKDD